MVEIYRLFRDVAERKPRASAIRKNISEVGVAAGQLARLIEKLDGASRMALADISKSTGGTPRRDAVEILAEHVGRLQRLQAWSEQAVDNISEDPPGPTSRADLIAWLMEGFAHAFKEATGEPFTPQAREKQIIATFVDVVDPDISPRSLDAAIGKAVLRTQN